MRAIASTSFVPKGRPRTAGFTIVELAVTMVIITILLGSILIPLNTQVESRNYDETQRVLERAREALLGFVAANGYFPCPADTASNGQEAAGTNHNASPSCPFTVGVSATGVYLGYLPAARLGIAPIDSQGYALDAWGLSPYNRIRYAVSAVMVNGFAEPFTRTNGMRTAGMSNIVNCVETAGASVCTPPPLPAGSPRGLLYVCNSGAGTTPTNCGTATKLTDNAIAVIWSNGPNAAIGPPNGNNSVHETQNPNFFGGSTDRLFVSKVKSGAPLDPNEFDDVVTWIGSATTFNRLVQAGQLP